MTTTIRVQAVNTTQRAQSAQSTQAPGSTEDDAAGGFAQILSASLGDSAAPAATTSAEAAEPPVNPSLPIEATPDALIAQLLPGGTASAAAPENQKALELASEAAITPAAAKSQSAVPAGGYTPGALQQAAIALERATAIPAEAANAANAADAAQSAKVKPEPKDVPSAAADARPTAQTQARTERAQLRDTARLTATAEGETGVAALAARAAAGMPRGEEELPRPLASPNTPAGLAPAHLYTTIAGMNPTTHTPGAVFEIRTPVGAPGWSESLTQTVLMSVGERVKEAEIRVQPQDLGPIALTVTLDGDSAHVAFNVAVPETRALVESSLPQLREALASAGISLAGSTVDGGAGQGPRDGANGSRSADGAPAAATDVTPAVVRISDRIVDVFA